jgi:hypothetical protein
MKVLVDKELMEEVLEFVNAMGAHQFKFGYLTEHSEYSVLVGKIKDAIGDYNVV